MRSIVKNIVTAYKIDLKINTAKYTLTGSSNYKNLIHRDEIALRLLATLPEELILIGDGTPSVPDKMNIGSLVECTANFHASGRKAEKVAQSGADYDIEINGIEYEVKACFNGSCYNTPIHSYNFDVILFNSDGIFLIPKNEISRFEKKGGKLPHKEVDGLEHFKFLEDLIKF